MDAFSTLFVHYENFQVIVCKGCRFAVVPDQVKAHLKQSHNSLTLKTRNEIAERIQQLEHIAYRREDVHYPAFEEEAIQELGPALENCYQCKECRSLTESRKGIEGDCRQKHGWASSKRRGGRGSSRRQPARNQPYNRRPQLPKVLQIQAVDQAVQSAPNNSATADWGS